MPKRKMLVIVCPLHGRSSGQSTNAPTHSFDATALPALTDSTYLMFAAVRYLAALRPDTRPKTTQSNKELPPSLLLPCIPPAASPAEYRPPTTRSSAPNDSASP